MPQTVNKLNMIMLTDPESPIAELYRTLRFNIECMASERMTRSIVITSAEQCEGKTTTAINLAIAFAKTGKRVILIDGNLRNPALHRLFGLNDGGGLVSIFTKRSSVNEMAQQTDIDNLTILTAGTATRNPSEILSLEGIDALLSELYRSYDFVLIDTPPASVLTDAKIIAAKCDGILLVIEQGKLKRALAQKIKEELTNVKAHLLGIVLNKTNSNKT